MAEHGANVRADLVEGGGVMGDERDIQREAAALHRVATDDSQNEPPDFDDDEEGDSMAVRDEREGLRVRDALSRLMVPDYEAMTELDALVAWVGQLTQE